MRRISLLLLSVMLLLGTVLVGGGAFTTAQEATPTDLIGHPIVGSWLLDTDVEDPENPPTLAVFTSDGIYVDTDAEGATGIGAWESTGDTTGELTIQYLEPEGTAIVRASLEVAAAEDILTAEYTIEFIGPDGASADQYGPGMAEATRLAVEPMGTPAGTLQDLFTQFEEAQPEATPQATPDESL
ncbi:MAG: hypothetical protein M3457_17870 [Chloroflexota bacterium]|nr:hypothetical protein [Chloroflexota bacterium]